MFESVVDVGFGNKGRSAVASSGCSKNANGMFGRKVEVVGSFDDLNCCCYCAERSCSLVLDDSLFLVLDAILLLAPSNVDRVDIGRVLNRLLL